MGNLSGPEFGGGIASGTYASHTLDPRPEPLVKSVGKAGSTQGGSPRVSLVLYVKRLQLSYNYVIPKGLPKVNLGVSRRRARD